MTDRIDLDTRVARWLTEDAPDRAPERLIHATRDRLSATQQVGRMPRLGWPLPRLNLRPVLAGAALLVGLAVLGITTLSLLNQRPPSIGARPSERSASASPTRPSPSPSPSAFTCPNGQGTCLGPLQPGIHSTSSFAPKISYTVPVGWSNTLDIRGEVDLSFAAGGDYTYPDGLTFHDGVSIFRRPVAESATSNAPLKGIGKTAKDLAQWLDGHADLVASGLTPVTVGGVPGYRITLNLPQGPRVSPDHCTTDHREPRCESLFVSDDPAATYGFGLVGPESAVVYLLDAPSGDTVMVVIDDVDGIDAAGLRAAAAPIVSSLTFNP
jgi:hypothetical protein